MKKKKNIKDFLLANPTMNPNLVAQKTGYSIRQVRHVRRTLGLPTMREIANSALVPLQAQSDIAERRLREDTKRTRKKYRYLQEEVERLQKERDAIIKLKDVTVTKLPTRKGKTSEYTAVVVASDWHIEETVEPDTVSGLNEYNLDIAKERAEKFFRSVVRLLKIHQHSSKIDTLVLALLGDFITNHIHEELMEGNSLLPIDALIFVQNLLASGIQFILDNTDVKIVLPCHSGNHARVTARQRVSTERGNSFEYYMYHQLANHFSGNKRVEFRIAHGYFSYMDINGFIIRFHHGHHLRYSGGVGGLFIPVNKAIAQWNKGMRANLDVFG